MSSSKARFTPLAAAVSGTLFLFSGSVPAEPQKSIYDVDQPSIYDGQKDERDLVVKRERNTDATHLLGEVRKFTEKFKVEPLLDKDGNIVRDIRIKIDGPSGPHLGRADRAVAGGQDRLRIRQSERDECRGIPEGVPSEVRHRVV